MNQGPETYEVSLASYKIVGWLSIVFFTFCSIASFMARQYSPIVAFGFFVALGIYTIVGAGKFVFSQEGVTHRTTFRTYRIHWKEVKGIEIGTADGTFVLHGENKRFVVAPPSAWSGPQRVNAYSFFATKLQDSGIIPYTSRVAAYKIHKNVRVYPDPSFAPE
jgi:hypothetical protein